MRVSVAVRSVFVGAWVAGGAAACGETPSATTGGPPGIATVGDAANGRLLLRQFGCGECHAIPGVVDANGNVGPPLAHIARRTYLAGRIPNAPANMVQWIRDPKRFDPATQMPDLQVGEAHARDIVAYLFTLE